MISEKRSRSNLLNTATTSYTAVRESHGKFSSVRTIYSQIGEYCEKFTELRKQSRHAISVMNNSKLNTVESVTCTLATFRCVLLNIVWPSENSIRGTEALDTPIFQGILFSHSRQQDSSNNIQKRWSQLHTFRRSFREITLEVRTSTTNQTEWEQRW